MAEGAERGEIVLALLRTKVYTVFMAEIGIGSTVLVFDGNRRVYAQDKSSPIYREYWAPVPICRAGHEYSPDNTHVSAKGRRVCCTCRTRNRRAFEARNKARTGRTRG